MSFRPLERPSVRRASVVALCLLALLFAVQTWRKAYRPDGNDLTSYLAASHALAEGSNPYAVDTPFPAIIPDFLRWRLIPLAKAPYDGAAVLFWFALSIAALAWVPRGSPDGRIPRAARATPSRSPRSL